MTSRFSWPRIRIKGTLQTITPLHVGSGDSYTSSNLKELKELEQDPEVAAIQRDASGSAYLPGSSLKGSLRRILVQAGAKSSVLDHLFGDANDSAGTGSMGHLTVFGCSARPAQPAHHYHFDDRRMNAGVMARTRIDPASGTASDRHLFHEEEILPGTEFDFVAEYADPSGNLPQEVLQVIDAMRDGFSLGASTGSAMGKLRLTLVAASRSTIDGSGTLVAQPYALPIPNQKLARQDEITLRLSCRGPYLTADGNYKPPARARDESGKKAKPAGAQMRALGVSEMAALGETGTPILLGSSLKGAMRSSYLWLCKGDEEKVGALFGSEDSASRVRMTDISAGACGIARIASVKLDRFTAGHIDQGLFDIACFVNPVFLVRIAVSSSIVAEFERLLTALEEDGLRLGLGGNRGFGWFKVERMSEWPA